MYVACTRIVALAIAAWLEEAGIDDVRILEPFDERDAEEPHGGLPVDWIESGDRSRPVTIGTGISPDRERVWNLLEAAGYEIASFVHPSAVIAESAEVGPGATIEPGVVIDPHARVDRGVRLAPQSFVGHHVRLGPFVTLGPRAAVAGVAEVGARTSVSLGATVRDRISVGADVTVGMGAAVVGDVADGETVLGVPARPKR